MEKNVDTSYGDDGYCEMQKADCVDIAMAIHEVETERLREKADFYGINWFLEDKGPRWTTSLLRVMVDFGMEMATGPVGGPRTGPGFRWIGERCTSRSWDRWVQSRKGTVSVSLGWMEKGGSMSGSIQFCRSDGVTWTVTLLWMIFCDSEGRCEFRMESTIYLRFEEVEFLVIPDDAKKNLSIEKLQPKFDLGESRQEDKFVWRCDLKKKIDFEDQGVQRNIKINYMY